MGPLYRGNTVYAVRSIGPHGAVGSVILLNVVVVVISVIMVVFIVIIDDDGVTIAAVFAVDSKSSHCATQFGCRKKKW